MRTIAIFDTTLRDGEQSPGAAMNADEKLELARELVRLGVDCLEAGFPASSDGDFEAVSALAEAVGADVTVCALARARKDDIAVAARALSGAKSPRIHTGFGVSPYLFESLGWTLQEATNKARESVAYGRTLVDDVQFYLEDATRAQQSVMQPIIEAVLEAGATGITLPDTTGYATPQEMHDLVAWARELCARAGHPDTRISVHCHNDLGLATANTLAGIEAGADEAQCTLNGIGERAGNAATEQVVMAIKARKDIYDVCTTLDTPEFLRASHLAAKLTGVKVPINQPLVGLNAFAHAAGIHQAALLHDRHTYEIIDPQEVGARATRFVLTARSGRHALRHRLETMGYTLPDEEFEPIYAAFLDLADRKKEIYDEDLESILSEELRVATGAFRLARLQVSCGSPGIPTATVELVTREGEALIDSAHGNGPVDAVYNAINRILNYENDLIEFSVQSITRGIDALGEVSIRIRSEESGAVYTGRGAHSDIVVAAARAYTDALNRLILKEYPTPSA